jgi:hypothetical protein
MAKFDPEGALRAIQDYNGDLDADGANHVREAISNSPNRPVPHMTYRRCAM